MIDATMVTAQNDSPEGDHLGARVLREVINTPAFRDILNLHIGEFQRGEGRALVKTFLSEDPALWMSLASATPQLVDAITESLATLGQELAAMPEHLVNAYLSAVIHEIDTVGLKSLPAVWTPLLARALPGSFNVLFDAVVGLSESLASLETEARKAALAELQKGIDVERAAAAINRLADLAILLGKEHPDLFKGDTAPDYAGLVRTIDHGRLRHAVAALSQVARQGTEGVLGQWLADPVAIANLVLILPTVLNESLRLLDFALSELDLPEEVLASAIFEVLREIDIATLSSLVNGVARTINNIHQGSNTLSADEPAFKEVLTELLDQSLKSLDLSAVTDAAVALGEDADVAARVVARRVTTDPELLTGLLNTSAKLINVALSTGREVMTEAEHLPDAAIEELGTRMPDVDPRSVGELLSQTLGVVTRWERLAARPDWTNEVLAAIDWDEAGDLLGRILPRVIEATLTSGWRKYRDDPEGLGAGLNDRLKRFNQFATENAPVPKGFVPRFLASLDTHELKSALMIPGRLLGGTVIQVAQKFSILQHLRRSFGRKK